MTVHRIEIAKKVKGSLMENEDWWYVCYDDADQTSWIEHQWDHVDAYNVARGSDNGTERHEIQEWLDGKKRGYENIEAALEEAKAASSAA